MHTTKYLIVGAGMTGDMAAKGIREHDIDGSIAMVGGDPHPTYKRPLLTKGLWQGAPEEKLWRDLGRGCRARHRPSDRLARPRGAHGGGRRRRGVLLGEAPARHRREAARDPWRRGRDLVPHPRRLPPPARDRAGGIARRRDRRWLHRLRDRGRPRRQRRPSHDALPGARDRLPPLPARALPVRRRVLPREGRGRAHRGAGQVGLGQQGRDRVGRHARGGRGRRRARRDPGHRPCRILRAGGERWNRCGRVRTGAWARGRLRRRRRGSLPRTRARHDHADRARGSRELARQGGRREHGRGRQPVRPPAVLLLRPLRPRLRGRRRLSTRGSRSSRTGRSRIARASSPTSRTASRAACCSGTCGTSSTPPAT